MVVKEFAKLGKDLIRLITNTLEIEKQVVKQAHIGECLRDMDATNLPAPSEEDIQFAMEKVSSKSELAYQTALVKKYIHIANNTGHHYYSAAAKSLVRKIHNADTREHLNQLLNGVQEITPVGGSPLPDESEGVMEKTIEFKRLPKYAILTLLYYHFLQIDRFGVISNVSEKEVAKAVGCSVRTVKNNNALLEQAGLILLSNNGRNVNVWIRGYKDYHQGGNAGYKSMTLSFFKELVAMDNVNEIRFMLRQGLKYDNDTVKRNYTRNKSKKVYSKISFNDAKVFLPKYTHYKSMINRIANNKSQAFETILKGSDVYFVMDEKFFGKSMKEHKTAEYMESIVQKLADYQEGLVKKDYDDFVQLGFEYGINMVIEALDHYIHESFYSPDAEQIDNKGAWVRTHIRKLLAGTEDYTSEFLISA
jgi:hypothetical protein